MQANTITRKRKIAVCKAVRNVVWTTLGPAHNKLHGSITDTNKTTTKIKVLCGHYTDEQKQQHINTIKAGLQKHNIIAENVYAAKGSLRGYAVLLDYSKQTNFVA